MRPRTVRLHISLPAAHERMRVRIPRNANRVAGFAIAPVILSMVEDLRIRTPVVVRFDQRATPQAGTRATRWPYAACLFLQAEEKVGRKQQTSISRREGYTSPAWNVFIESSPSFL